MPWRLDVAVVGDRGGIGCDVKVDGCRVRDHRQRERFCVGRGDAYRSSLFAWLSNTTKGRT